MLDKIKNTVKHSAVYAVGNITTKLIGVILLPLYTSYISVEEYGVLGILEITILILTQVFIFGLPQSYLRFYEVDEYKNERKKLFTTIFVFLLALGIFLEIFSLSFSKYFSSIFEKPELFKNYIELSIHVVALRTLNSLALNVLRAKNKSKYYAISNVIKLIVTLSLNIYFIAFIGLGIKGILYSYIISEIILLIILSPQILIEFDKRFNWKVLQASLAFGIPLIFTGFAHMLLNIGDRYILKILTNYEQVGLYDLGYRVAGVLNAFAIQSFTLGLLPIAYKMFQKPGDKRYYSKIMTYYFFVICWGGLFLSLFGENIIKFFALNKNYWEAYTVIPLIVAGYIFSGANSIANLGLYLKQKTKIIAISTIGASLLNIVLNFLLIPHYKMIGAAVATIISFGILYIITLYFAQKSYRIPYEFKKILLALSVSLGLFYFVSLAAIQELGIQLLLKFVALIIFPIVLYFFKFYEKIEIERLKEAFNKLRTTSKK